MTDQALARVPRPVPPAEPSDAACDVLRRALTLVLLDVAGWDQSTWGVRRRDAATGTCRTAYCVAGHVAVHVLGCPPVWSPPVADLGDGERAFLNEVWFTEPSAVDGEPLTWTRSVSDVAEEALELTVERADLLFSEARSLRRLVELAYRFTGGRVDLLADYAALAARDRDVARRDAERDRAVGDACADLVTLVVAGNSGTRETYGEPLEDALGDDRTWWTDALETAAG